MPRRQVPYIGNLTANLPDHIAMEAWVAARATVKYSVGSDGTWTNERLVDPMHPCEGPNDARYQDALGQSAIKRLRIPLRHPKRHWSIGIAAASGLKATSSSSSSSSSSGCPRRAPTEGGILVGWLMDGDFIPIHEQQEPMTSLVSPTQYIYTRSELLRERVVHGGTIPARHEQSLSDEQTQQSLAAAHSSGSGPTWRLTRI